jgi:hypothetical protein
MVLVVLVVEHQVLLEITLVQAAEVLSPPEEH